MGRIARRFGLTVAALLLSVPGPARATGCLPPQQVHFAPGAHVAELSGEIPRGSRDCFTFVARRRQRLLVSQRGSNEGNLAMQLYPPPWQVRATRDGPEIAGRALPGAGEGEDAAGWEGVLGRGGRYLLVLGPTRGGAAYRVTLEVR